MELSENLFVIAQLAVVSAGFASFVAVIGERQGRDASRCDAARVEGIPQFTLLAGGLALLPFVPFQAGLSDVATRRLCAGIFAVSSAAFKIYTLRKLRGIPRYTPASPWGVFWIGLSTFAILVLAAASGAWLTRPAAAYLWRL